MKTDEQKSNAEIIFTPPDSKIINSIQTSNAKKIILTGNRRSGKTTTLKYLTNINNKNNIIIYLDYRFINSEIGLTNLEYRYYHELNLAKKIIDFIKNNHNNYYSNIRLYQEFIKNKINEFNNYLLTKPYSSLYITDFKQGILVSKIIEILRKIANINEITLIIDHFDFVGNSSKRFQENMTSYFLIFDKLIITSNDQTLKKLEVKDAKEQKGYQIIEVDYTKQIKNIKKILLTYFKWWFNEINIKIYDITTINKIYQLINNDQFCYELIKKVNGNIEMMIDIIRMYYTQDCSIEEAITNVINTEIMFNNITATKKLHI